MSLWTLMSVGLGVAMVTEPPQVLPNQAFFERKAARDRMVDGQLLGRDIRHKSVLAAMRKVPRHAFVPKTHQKDAYQDHPLPIGYNQTISQPYIVAFMTQALNPKPTDNVLEIGTGSGYQAAVLAELVKTVYTIEIVAPLGERSKVLLKTLGYKNIKARVGDGYQGWKEAAPFDLIMVTAAPDHVPPMLVAQLKVGGRLILPVGDTRQELVVIEKTAKGVTKKSVLQVRFVPMTGQAQEPRRSTPKRGQ